MTSPLYRRQSTLEGELKANPDLLKTLAPSASAAAPHGSRLINVKRLKESGLGLDRMLEQIETALLCEALDLSGGNQTEAAEILGLNRTTFFMRFRALRGRGINALAYRLKGKSVV